MSTCLSPSLATWAIAALLRRESATEAMIRQIDEKLLRLDSARRNRMAALKRIRCELAQAHEAKQAAAGYNDAK